MLPENRKFRSDSVNVSTRVSSSKMRLLAILSASLFFPVAACAQNCPVRSESGLAEASEASTLHGRLILHYGLREWLGLKLDQPACGQADIQLVFSDAKMQRSMESFRGCDVSATGKLFGATTAYYSTDVAISDPAVKPDSSCQPFPIEPDPTAAPIPANLKHFRASISVDYRGNGRVDVRVWQSTNKKMLQPWRAFVYYFLTGGADVMWFGCREGFSIHGMTQTPKSPDGFLGDAGAPGTVLQDMKGVNKVEFTCDKESENTSSKKTSVPD
jgi:hypothetical protein